MENFSYRMVFVSTLHKQTCSNAIDKFQVCIKDRKGEEMVLYGRLHVKIHQFVKMAGKQTHSAICTYNCVFGKKNKEKYIISNKYAKNLGCKANKISGYF